MKRRGFVGVVAGLSAVGLAVSIGITPAGAGPEAAVGAPTPSAVLSETDALEPDTRHYVAALTIDGTEEFYEHTAEGLLSLTPTMNGKGYRFMSAGKKGRNPARWNNCTPVNWYLNRNGASKATIKDLRYAITHVAEATGLTFKYAGTTKYLYDPNRNPWDEKPGAEQPDGLSIGFTTSKDWPKVVEGAIGLGGLSTSGGDEWGAYIYRGRVLAMLDAFSDARGYPRSKEQRRDAMRELLLHEIGHAMNLDHVTDEDQVMYPSVQWGDLTPAYGDGDRAGLKFLSELPCFEEDEGWPTALS